METIPLVVIAGPTASGKTALAIRLAKQFEGEIICADSRTVYRGLDIGTAKPTALEQAQVPHWGLDLVEPGERFTVADFKIYADAKIEEIRSRGHVPFLVGGTGLYIDTVVYDYQFRGAANMDLRHKLTAMTVGELQEYCNKNGIALPENSKNKRYLVRSIEQNEVAIRSGDSKISTSIIVGIATEKSELRARIVARAEQLFDNGVVEEATKLGKKYGWDNEAMTGNIYPLVKSYLAGESTLHEIKDKFTTLDWRLAKRQLTYMRRNTDIRWLPLTEAEAYIAARLAPE